MMKTRGLYFKISQNDKYCLNQLFGAFNCQDFFWYNVSEQSEVWSLPDGDDLFKKNVYSGRTLERRIKKPHKVIFLKFQAYHEKGKYHNISTYDDWLGSPCCAMVLIWDCEFVEVYSKDEELTQRMYESAQQNGYKEITIITDENDKRVNMDIL